jgi:hypothetical protein
MGRYIDKCGGKEQGKKDPEILLFMKGQAPIGMKVHNVDDA